MTMSDGDKQSAVDNPLCDACSGLGEIIWPKLHCITCNGEKVVDKQKVLEIDISKGINLVVFLT